MSGKIKRKPVSQWTDEELNRHLSEMDTISPPDPDMDYSPAATDAFIKKHWDDIREGQGRKSGLKSFDQSLVKSGSFNAKYPVRKCKLCDGSHSPGTRIIRYGHGYAARQCVLKAKLKSKRAKEKVGAER